MARRTAEGPVARRASITPKVAPEPSTCYWLVPGAGVEPAGGPVAALKLLSSSRTGRWRLLAAAVVIALGLSAAAASAAGKAGATPAGASEALLIAQVVVLVLLGRLIGELLFRRLCAALAPACYAGPRHSTVAAPVKCAG